MSVQFCSLASGSSGNASLVVAGDTRLLIDAGLTGKRIVNLLNEQGVLPETLSGILVTHEHSDHVQGVGVLARKYHLPVYANAGTWEAMYRVVGDIPAAQRRVFETGEDFFVDQVNVLPLAIEHDTVDPVAFRLFHQGVSLAVATDMGHVSKQLKKALSGVDLLLIESNHDPDMLKNNERYPSSLKQRILGRRGHLSNGDCGLTLLTLLEGGVRHALLGHLSHDNNTPELAMGTVTETLASRGVVMGRDIHLNMCWRDRAGEVYRLE